MGTVMQILAQNPRAVTTLSNKWLITAFFNSHWRCFIKPGLLYWGIRLYWYFRTNQIYMICGDLVICSTNIVIVECVRKIRPILFSVFHYFSVKPILLWWLRDYIYIYILILCLIIIIKSEVWTITHCLGLGHETMVCAVWLSVLSCAG